MLHIATLSRPGLEIGTFTVAAGEGLAVMGPSGSGKSLLLRAIVDLDLNEASITLDGRPRQSFSAPRWRALVGYLPAETGWWADRAGDHFPDSAEAERQATRLGLEPSILDSPVARLSTGEKQRLGLIRALQVDPRVLLLDEPTSALDKATRELVEALLLDWLDDRHALVIVTHDEAQAESLTSQRVHLSNGRQASGNAGDKTA